MIVIPNLFLLACASLFLRSGNLRRTDSLPYGISFENGLSWKEILVKAKSERKYIFIDCFASWCGPCKKMERDVYPLEKVGEYFNRNYISVKVQMDTTKQDDPDIRSFYSDAHRIGLDFKVQAYPTLLLFNPDGHLLARRVGAMDADNFLQLGADVLAPDNDYYAKLREYESGKRDLKEMIFLATTAQELLGDTVFGEKVATEYLKAIGERKWLSAASVQFMKQFIHGSSDAGFSFFIGHTDEIDSVMQDGNFAESLIQYISFKEIALPDIEKYKIERKDPDWAHIQLKVAAKYGDYYADRVCLAAQCDWEKQHRHWSKHSTYLVRYVERYGPKLDSAGPMKAFYFNNNAWDIFEHSSDTGELTTALGWSLFTVVWDPTPEHMDTYANVLYKLGREKAAVRWEEVAAALSKNDRSILSNLSKMKQGLPTWSSN